MADKVASKGLGRRWQGLPLWAKVLVGLVLGVTVGLLMGPMPVENRFESAEDYQAAMNAIHPFSRMLYSTFDTIGTLFKNAFRMLIVPLIFFSLVSGITSMEDLKEMGRVGGKTAFIYLLTTAVAVAIGLGFGFAFQPGAGADLGSGFALAANESRTFGEFLIGLVPTNPVKAFAEGNVLQIITFAILIGIAINMAGKKAATVSHFMDEAAEVMYSLTHMVIQVTPYGVFALMAVIASQYGLDVLRPLAKLVVVVYAALIFHAAVVYGFMVRYIGKMRLKPFFKGLFDAQLVAYSTASSAATLPVTMSCVQDNLGVSKRISSFILPLGATINMDGTALYQGVAALFVAQAFGIDLTLMDGITIILTCTLASIGSAAVPGAGLVMLTMVLSSVGLPLEGIGMIYAVDRIMDMMRTAVNVTGDSMVSVLVAKSENELDEKIFNKEPTI